jgi:hypothetical protein
LCAHKLDVAIFTASEKFIDRFAVVPDKDRFMVVPDKDRFAEGMVSFGRNVSSLLG